MAKPSRRHFIVSASALALASLARAQEQRRRRIGVLIPFRDNDSVAQRQVAVFREELANLGWIDGRSAVFDYRWAGGELAAIASAAKEIVNQKPDIILARTTPATAALLRETKTVPILFVVVSDPVGDGLVASLARPGGNITGFTNIESSFGGKWLQLLREIAPNLSQVAVMYGPKTAPGGGTFYRRLVEQAASALDVKAVATPVYAAADIQSSFQTFAQQKNMGLIVTPDVTTLSHHRLITSLAAEYGMPSIYAWGTGPDAGGLMSYGVEYLDLYRRAAGYADRILRGAKAGDLPIQQPTKFELVINVRTAKALGLSIPGELLVRADRLVK